MKLRMGTVPMGVPAVKVSSSSWSWLRWKWLRRNSSAFTCPGPVGQRGPMATNSRAYSSALAPSKCCCAFAAVGKKASAAKRITKACEIPGLKFETRGTQKYPVPHSCDFFLSQEWEARSEEHTSELQSRQYLVC